MIATILDAALRSLLLAILVWSGLRIFRVRSVLAERAAWAAVLAGSLLMPAALPLSARWSVFPSQTLVIPSSLVQMQSSVPQDQQSTSTENPAEPGGAPPPVLPENPAPTPNDFAAPVQPPAPATSSGFRSAATSLDPSLVERLRNVPRAVWVNIAIGLYVIVAAAFLIRLLCGLASILRLWHGSMPIAPAVLGDTAGQHADVKVRFSRSVLSPLAVGSGVLLPEDYAEWDQEKLRVVLAHERAHVFHRDFYWQLLASLYAALTWFSPLGWWLKRKLSDLGEAISDHAGLEEARNRSAYARILLEFAATPHPNFIGVAMARKSNLSRRIERLLNDRVFRQAFAGSRRVRIAFLLAPFAMFAFTALIRVQAASPAPPEMLAFINPLDLLPAAAPAPAAAVPPAVHSVAAVVASAVQQAAPATAPSQSEATFDRTLTVNGKLDLRVTTASGNIHLTHGSGTQVQIHGRVHSREASDGAEVSAIAANPPIEQDGNAIRIGKEHQQGTNHISIDYEIVAPADAALATETGSGSITDEGVGQAAKLETGSGNITATGLKGGFTAETGSGNIAIENAGEGESKAETGSGRIDVKGANGSLKAETGSGEIKAEGTPSAEWKLATGSGNINISVGNAPLTLDASTASGTIAADHGMAMETSSDHHHVHGQLNGGGPAVKIETGSGNIHIQ